MESTASTRSIYRRRRMLASTVLTLSLTLFVLFAWSALSGGSFETSPVTASSAGSFDGPTEQPVGSTGVSPTMPPSGEGRLCTLTFNERFSLTGAVQCVP